MRQILIAVPFLTLILSGCDNKETPSSSLALVTQAQPYPAQCQPLPDTTASKNHSNYPYWLKNVRNNNIESSLIELAHLENTQGKTLNYYSLAIIIQAEKMTLLVAQETFTPQEAQRQVKVLESLIATAQMCYKVQPPSSSTNLIRYSFLLDTSTQYSEYIEERIQRNLENKPYDAGEKTYLGGPSEWMVKGSPGKVIRAYNKMVSDFNLLS